MKRHGVITIAVIASLTFNNFCMASAGPDKKVRAAKPRSALETMGASSCIYDLDDYIGKIDKQFVELKRQIKDQLSFYTTKFERSTQAESFKALSKENQKFLRDTFDFRKRLLERVIKNLQTLLDDWQEA